MDDEVGLDGAQVERLVIDVEHTGDLDRRHLAAAPAFGAGRGVVGVDRAVSRAAEERHRDLEAILDPARQGRTGLDARRGVR